MSSSSYAFPGRLVGLEVKASASGVEDLGFESRLRRDFLGSSHTSDLKIGTPVASHTSDLKIGTPVATLPGAWHYRGGPVSVYCDWVR